MAACSQTDIPVLNQQVDPCVGVHTSTNCIFYPEAITYLFIDPNEDLTAVIQAMVLSLQSNNTRTTQLEEENAVQAEDIAQLKTDVVDLQDAVLDLQNETHTLQDAVDEGNTIVMPANVAKGIDITLVNLATSYQNGISVTVPAQTGIYPTFQPAPDAFKVYLNGQNPSNLTGFVGGFVSEATGADNIGFFAGSNTGAQDSTGFLSRSTDAHTGPHFIAQKSNSGVNTEVFRVENNGDTKVNTLSAAPSSLDEDGFSRSIIYAINSDTAGPGGELYGSAITGQCTNGKAIVANGKIGIYASGVDKGIEAYTANGAGTSFYTETDTGLGFGSLSLGTGTAISGSSFGTGTAIQGYSILGKAATFSIRNNDNVNTSNIVEFDNNGVLQAYVKHNGTIVSNRLLINTTSDNGVDKLQVNGSLLSTLDAKINNLTIGKGNNSIAGNTAIGASALKSNISGTNNTFIGENSGYLNTLAGSNVGVGINTLYSNSSALAIQNTAVGSFALQNNTEGYNNSAFGYFTLNLNTTGYENVAIGKDALRVNLTGLRNTAVGAGAMIANTSGLNNVALGKDALINNTTGNYNVVIGNSAQTLLGTNSNSIVIGRDAVGLGANTTAIGNTNTVTAGIFGTLVSYTTTPVVAAQTAQLQVESTTKGFLPPRMTNAQRLAIISPATGLMVYCTDAAEGLYIKKSTGWVLIG